MTVVAFSECKKQSCSIQERKRGDSSLHPVLYLPFSSGFNCIWVTFQYHRGWRHFRVRHHRLGVLPGKADKNLLPHRQGMSTQHKGRDSHSGHTLWLVMKPLFRFSGRNKKKANNIFFRSNSCFRGRTAWRNKPGLVFLEKKKQVCFPCPVWFSVCRHSGGSPVRAEWLAEVADRTGLHSCFHLLFWLDRGLSLTRLPPGSARLSPGAGPKPTLPGKGHTGRSRSTGSHLLHPIINTLYY